MQITKKAKALKGENFMSKLNIKNKRMFRNVMMLLIIAVLSVGVFFTFSGLTQSTPGQAPEQDGQMQMQMSGNSQNSSTPPEKPSDDNNASAPQGDNSNSNDSSNNESSNNNSSDDGNSNASSNSNQQPTPPSNDSSNSGANGQTPNGQMPQNSNQSDTQFNYNYIILAVLILLICAVLIYLIMSGFNKKSVKTTFKSIDKIIIYVLVLIVATSGMTFGGIYASKHFLSNNAPNSMQAQNENVDASGKTEVDGQELTLGDEYEATEADESAILVSNGGNATIDGAKITKSSGDSSNTESSEFYGVNSGVLVQKNSTATIKNATISTSAKGSNAVFSTGENSKIYISDSTITTTGESSSRGLDATYGGYIEADNVKITTQGGSCASLATDRGEGTVKATNSTLETNGKGSPVIYSTGDITLSNSTGTANGSQMVVIEGKNNATVTSSKLTATGNGNRGDTDVCGVMIYQSMSGDAGEGTGTFTAKNSTLSISKSSKYYKSAPMFFITNTDAIINLNNTKLSFGSGVLLNAKATSEWGNSGSNGGNVTLNAENQTLDGDIEADEISTVSISLKSSSYTGSINNSNSAKEISLTLDKSSKIKLTADTYVTSLDDKDTSYSNIDFNGYKLYVNSKAIN